MSAPVCLPLLPAHLPDAAAIEATATEPWSLAALTEQSRSESGRLFGLFDDGTLLGAAVFQLAAGEAELLSITLTPAVRGKRFSGPFLADCLQKLRQEGCEVCFLEVRSRNVPALALYTSQGFFKVGLRRGFYRRPDDDAIVMKRDWL